MVEISVGCMAKFAKCRKQASSQKDFWVPIPWLSNKLYTYIAFSGNPIISKWTEKKLLIVLQIDVLL